MCKKNNLFFKTWTLVFYVYYVTNNPMLQAMETESFTESPRSTGYPVNKALMLVRDTPTTPGWAAIQHDDKQLVNRTIKTESFAEFPRYVTWLEKTELTLVCDSANTSGAVIHHEDKVFGYRSKSSSAVLYTLPSLSCKDMGHYMCVTNTTRHMYVLVFGCPPKLCLPHDKVLEADLGQDVMFDVCVMIPAPFDNMPITVNYKNTWLYNGQCVSRLCVTWTNVEFYRFNVKIIISNVSKEDYGKIILKFGTSHAYENYTFNYFPLLVPRTMKTERFTTSRRHVRYPEKTALMLVCHPPNTSDWAAILHEDKVLVKKRSLSATLLYTFQSLSCTDSGQYLCITNTTHDINLSVFGCPPHLCLPHDKVLEADLGQDVMFDVCVMIPNPVIDIPIMVAYKNTWLYKGQCVSRLCVTWTNVRFDLYRFNVKITISNVSEKDYGEMEFKFGTSYIHENLSVNYFPVLVPRGTNNSKDRNDTDDSMKYMIPSIILVLFCIIGCGLLSFKKVRKSIQRFRQDFVSKCFCLRQNESGNQNRVSETVPAYSSVYDSCPEQNPEPSVEHAYNVDSETTNPKNLYDDIQDTSQNSRHLNPVD